MLRPCSVNNSNIGEASAKQEQEHWRASIGVASIGVRVDASYRLLYDELGKGA